MVNKVRIAVLLLLIAGIAQAQNDSTKLTKKWFNKIYYNLQLGIVTEESLDNERIYRPTANFVAGYKLSQFFQPGIGIGYDEHRFFSSMPITLWIQGELLDKSATPFYYVQGGRANYWRGDDRTFTDVHGGKYFELGMGYSWQLEKMKLKLSGGWRKQVFTSITNYNYYGDWLRFSYYLPYPHNTEKTTWDLEKVVLKMTVEF